MRRARPARHAGRAVLRHRRWAWRRSRLRTALYRACQRPRQTFQGPGDVDKNEAISALEAFQYADRKTAAFYESQKRLATEHAVIEDTGKKEAVRAASAENGEGLLATNFILLRLGAAQKAANDPAKRALLDKKEELERKIDLLKYQKAAMSAEDYKSQLSAALLELARVQEDLDK